MIGNGTFIYYSFLQHKITTTCIYSSFKKKTSTIMARDCHYPFTLYIVSSGSSDVPRGPNRGLAGRMRIKSKVGRTRITEYLFEGCTIKIP